MKINHSNPNINVLNTLGVEQAARKAAQEKAAENAKAHAQEETLRLQEIAESLKENRDGRKKNTGDPSQQGRRNARYRPDGTVESEGSDTPDVPPHGGIDIRA